jgi:hypothetical protein
LPQVAFAKCELSQSLGREAVKTSPVCRGVAVMMGKAGIPGSTVIFIGKGDYDANGFNGHAE